MAIGEVSIVFCPPAALDLPQKLTFPCHDAFCLLLPNPWCVLPDRL
jgi:hypothetical protein